MATRSIKLANAVLGVEVDERSVFGEGEVGLVIVRLARPDAVLTLQVPPRPPKRRSTDRLFFCQSSLAKTQ